MILKALYDYYNRCGDLPMPGMEEKEIGFIIVLSKEGRFVRFEDFVVQVGVAIHAQGDGAQRVTLLDHDKLGGHDDGAGHGDLVFNAADTRHVAQRQEDFFLLFLRIRFAAGNDFIALDLHLNLRRVDPRRRTLHVPGQRFTVGLSLVRRQRIEDFFTGFF